MAIICKTIGHSNHSLDEFTALLKNANINYLIDCRSTPYSHNSPQFNAHILPEQLLERGIKYLFMGIELGGRPESSKYYTNNIVDYVKMAKCNLFANSIKILTLLCKTYNICLMCSEDLPEKCHRCLLIGRALQNINMDVLHILPDSIEITQKDIETKLLKKYGNKLAFVIDRIGYVYEIEGRKIAYRK